MKKKTLINEKNNKELNETMNTNHTAKKKIRINLNRLAALILSVTLPLQYLARYALLMNGARAYTPAQKETLIFITAKTSADMQ